MRLSYSKLNTYRQCPLRYRFTYLERLPRRPRRLFRAARRVHYALMRWLTYARDPEAAGGPRWEEVRAAYDAAWGLPQEPSLADDREYLEGLRLLEAFHAAQHGRPCRAVLLEHRFAVPLGPHLLVGALDRVDATETGYEVIDYKLDRELRTQQEVDEDLQLGLYQLALERGNGIVPEALTLYFLRHNIARTTCRTRQQIRELEAWVVATGEAIQKERVWSPCPGAHCSGCDFRAVCPAHGGAGRPGYPPGGASEGLGAAPPEGARRLAARDAAQLSLWLPGPEESLDAGSEATLVPASQLTLPLV